MIGKLILKDDKLYVHHIKGGSTYQLNTNQLDHLGLSSNVISTLGQTLIKVLENSSYVDFTLVQGDRYGLVTNAVINYHLSTDEVRQWKLDELGV